MSVQLIAAKDFIEMPWKNGQGITYQVDLESLNNQWLWRISMALVDKETIFSEFKNFNRLLTVLEGDGISLNQKLLQPKQIIFFHGEEAIHCRLVNSKIKDLGLIYNRDHVSADMEYLYFSEEQTNMRLLQLFPISFIFCFKGEVIYNDQKLCAGEFFKTTQQSEITFSYISENTELFLIKILCHLDQRK